ncbi:MAG TPA: hypothetical protein VK507_06675 [Iamia sp.]|nr:hypothetical protein [Iamia sp.]
MDGRTTTARERMLIYLGVRKVPPASRTTRAILVGGVIAGALYGIGMGLWFGFTDGWDAWTAVTALAAAMFFGTAMTLIAFVQRR